MSIWNKAKYEYECLGCGHKWERPMPSGMNTKCPNCSHLYFKWVNFERKFNEQKEKVTDGN